VVSGHRILVGRSARTNEEGIAELARLTSRFGYRVTPVRTEGCLHLKTGCTALPDGRLLINRRWIDTSELGDFDLVDVPEAEPWGGDVGYVKDTIFAAAAYPRTAETLEKAGYKVRPVDVSEFAKAEGGVTCMSLVFSA
jgi:dimethylargininase